MSKRKEFLIILWLTFLTVLVGVSLIKIKVNISISSPSKTQVKITKGGRDKDGSH